MVFRFFTFKIGNYNFISDILRAVIILYRFKNRKLTKRENSRLHVLYRLKSSSTRGTHRGRSAIVRRDEHVCKQILRTFIVLLAFLLLANDCKDNYLNALCRFLLKQVQQWHWPVDLQVKQWRVGISFQWRLWMLGTSWNFY